MNRIEMDKPSGNSEMEVGKVDLGFIEECPLYLLTNRYFPSKVGGKPAWLQLKNLPKTENLMCNSCREPFSFLCQIYAPIESDPAAFHRTIYLFICRAVGCSRENSAVNLRAFRSQLKRENDFYSPIAPDEVEELSAIEPSNQLCNVCGCPAPQKCSQCKKTFYCSKSHQRIDWKAGHKQICEGKSQTAAQSGREVLFPEYVIEIEPEIEDLIQKQPEDDQETEKRRLNEYEKLVREGKSGNLSDVPESDLAQCAEGQEEDKVFKRFKKRIASNPEQILRYQRGGEPLLIANPQDPLVAIPDCELCGNKRIFEFQVMPQLLNYLKDDSIDWGTILVYTCSSSCNVNDEYVMEFVVKQDITTVAAENQET